MAATLILRTVKGSPLLNIEVDNNFSNLNTFGQVVSSNVGIISNLITEANSNVVAAVNELKNTTFSKGSTFALAIALG